MTTDTIRLSDRLELLPPGTAGNGNRKYHALMVDGRFNTYFMKETADALIAACNPPRYDLPSGIIHGSDGKFYLTTDSADVPEGWEWFQDGRWVRAAFKRWYPAEARPTAANPVLTLPEHTFPLPDGRLACLRRDAAALRAQGATLHYTDGDKSAPSPSTDTLCPSEVLVVEFPPPAPATERVSWHEAIRDGRKNPDNGHTFRNANRNDDGTFTLGGGYNKRKWSVRSDASGRVTVLVDGDQR